LAVSALILLRVSFTESFTSSGLILSFLRFFFVLLIPSSLTTTSPSATTTDTFLCLFLLKTALAFAALSSFIEFLSSAFFTFGFFLSADSASADGTGLSGGSSFLNSLLGFLKSSFILSVAGLSDLCTLLA
jgi:hypothetical protein